MGRVYRVHHNSWNMDLAVKQPLASIFTKPKGKADFIREAETWVDLGLHPHITSCYYVRTVQEIPLIFVEFMDGGSLEHWIQRKGYDLYAGTQDEILQRILDIAIQFAWGLAYAHDCSLVHQDVKPLNVLMTSDGVVKVTDFGLAKARAKAGETTQNAGARGLVSGSMHTVAYRSPEQARGDPLDHTTDIWSWGVSVLEMFTGRISWQDGQAILISLESYFKYPDDNNIPRMPTSLGDLLRQCFRNAPADRPEDMPGIAEELKNIFRKETGQDYPREKPDVTELRADSLNNKALTMLDLGRPEQAEPLLEQALAADSQHVAATYNLGLLRWRSGRMTDVDVRYNLKQIQENQPDSEKAASALGWVCLESGRFDEALTYFEQAIQLGADNDSEQGLTHARCLVESGAGACLRHLYNEQTRGVTSIAFNPDGQTALFGSTDRTLRLWDLTTGNCLRTYEGHTEKVTSVAFSPDGRRILSGSEDKTLKLWNPAKDKCLRTFEGHTNKVSAIAFSPDGRRALSGSWDKTLKLWNLANGNCLRTFEGNDFSVIAVAFSPDGQLGLSGSWLDTIKFWDLATGTCLRTLEGHKYATSSVAFSPDGSKALSWGVEKTLKLWDLANGECLHTLKGHTDRVTTAAFSPGWKLGSFWKL